MNPSPEFKARRDLPENFSSIWHFDITQKREAFLLSVWGAVLMIAAWIGFLALARHFQPTAFPFGFMFRRGTFAEGMAFVGELILVFILMIVLHEGLHGIFFWLITHDWPKYELKLSYASAAAPDWYIPRGKYFYTALAPLVGITLLCLAVLAWLPAGFAMPAFLMLVFNTSGAIGDIWVVLRLLFCPVETYIKDYGNNIEFYSKKS